MRRLVLVELFAVATLSAIGATGFHRIFAGRSFLLPVLGAALAPVLLSGLARWRHARPTTSLLLSAAGYVLYTIYAVLGSTAPNIVPTATTFRELAGGITGGWADLLSTSLPARPEPRLLVVAVAVVWAGAFLGSELAQRSRNVVAPAVPPLAAYSYTLLYAVGQPASQLTVPVAVAAATLLLVLTHANRWAAIEPGGLRLVRAGDRPTREGAGVADDEPEPTIEVSADRRILIGLPVIALALVVAAVASALPTSALRASFDPRNLRSERIEARDVVSPLAGVRRQLLFDPARPLFTLDIDRLSDALLVPRVRLAVLDRYDGATWSSTGEFSRVGSVLPEVEGSSLPTREVRQVYTIGKLVGVWLPAADRPISVETGDEALEVQFDKASGTMITSRDSLDGLTYAVTSAVSNPQPDELAKLQPGSGKAFAVTTDTTGMPDEIRDLARTVTSGAGTPYEQLKALERALSTRYGYSVQVESGHSYGHLLNFLTKSRRGYAEQFATAFAVMARALGVPTRLVVGYLTNNDPSGSATATEPGEITTAQAHVWPEAYLQGAGWVAFEPTPDRIPSDPPPPDDPALATGSAGAVETQAEAPSELSNPAADAGKHGSWLTIRILVLALLVVLVLSVPLWPVALKALVRRRRRRLATTASQQILGAWTDALDHLLELKIPIRRSMTAREVVAVASEHLTPPALALLSGMAPLVTTALFAPSLPTLERAAEMEDLTHRFLAELAAGQSVATKLVAAINPRPLVYARR